MRRGNFFHGLMLAISWSKLSCKDYHLAMLFSCGLTSSKQLQYNETDVTAIVIMMYKPHLKPCYHLIQWSVDPQR